MVTVGTSAYTLWDWARRKNPDGTIAAIAEVLTKMNPILRDMKMREGNLATGHQTTKRVSLASGSWVGTNEGTGFSKSTTGQMTDTCAILEMRSRIEKKQAELGGDPDGERASEATAHIEGMSQSLATALFYSNGITDPKEPHGLAPRLNALSQTNVIPGGGSDDGGSTSVFLVSWALEHAFGIYPKGLEGSFDAIKHEDLGIQLLEVTAGSGLYARYYVDEFNAFVGLCVRDDRYTIRMPNIDVSAYSPTAATGTDLITKMIEMLYALPENDNAQPVFYMNRNSLMYLDYQTLNQTNMHLQYGPDQYGRPVPLFRGVPVRQCDAILDTEDIVA